jgi:hypothetical protein
MCSLDVFAGVLTHTHRAWVGAGEQRRFLELVWPTTGASCRVEARKGWTKLLQLPPGVEPPSSGAANKGAACT